MTVTHIMKLADGEELISYESVEPRRSLLDDPRRGALERRGAAEAAGRASDARAVHRSSRSFWSRSI
jgi:hypothetical protein